MKQVFVFTTLAVLLLRVTVSQAQIEFYGTSESIQLLNTSAAEDFLCLAPTGDKMAFTRSGYSGNVGGSTDGGDIWFTRKAGNTWSPATNWLDINDAYFASPIGFSASGDALIYNYLIDERKGIRSEIRIVRQGKTEVLDTKFLNNRSFHQSGSLSIDESFIILSMQSAATKGNEDLYVLRLQNGQWSAPINLGTNVNSPSQEVTPYLAADNKTLFFATNGRSGFGSFDLYYAVRLDDSWRNWSEPVNLGSAVNTSGAETSFTFAADGDYAYYVSTTDSDGYGDIRRIAINPDIEPVDATALPVSQNKYVSATTGVRVLNARTGAPVIGEVTVTYNGKNTTTVDLDAVGGLIRTNLGINQVEVTKVGFVSGSTAIIQKEVVELVLQPLEVGSTVTLEHVLFYRGSPKMLDEAYQELDEVVKLMQDNPEMNILLKGHTDNRGNAEANLELSERRVEAVADYLVQKGIKAKRVQGKGFGGTQPIAPNDTEENRRINRRVEFEIIN